MGIEQIQVNPATIKAGIKARGFKGQSTGSGVDFNSMLDAVGAFGSAASTAGQMYAGPKTSAVLGAAFSGIGATSSVMANPYNSASAGYGSGLASAPYLAAGMSGNYSGGNWKMDMGYGGMNSTPMMPGVEGPGTSQMDMVNTMNQNNLQLLELQAVMQNNMQSWNTKSNILSADHRARMTMIEKFTARG